MPTTNPMTIIFNNFAGHTKGMLHNLACQQLDDCQIAEADCLIDYRKAEKRPDWPFSDNYIEITAPATKTSHDMMPVVEASMGIAGMLDVPLIITRDGSRSIILPYCGKVKL